MTFVIVTAQAVGFTLFAIDITGAEFNARGFILIPSDSGTVHAVIAKSAGGIIPLALLRFAEKDFFIGIPLEEEVT